MMQPKTRAKAKLRARLTGADSLKLTPPSHRGVRYQLIEGDLLETAEASRAHQGCTRRFYMQLTLQTDDLGISETTISPLDVAIDEHNTF